jgi:hypothetical protein
LSHTVLREFVKPNPVVDEPLILRTNGEKSHRHGFRNVLFELGMIFVLILNGHSFCSALDISTSRKDGEEVTHARPVLWVVRDSRCGIGYGRSDLGLDLTVVVGDKDARSDVRGRFRHLLRRVSKGQDTLGWAYSIVRSVFVANDECPH